MNKIVKYMIPTLLCTLFLGDVQPHTPTAQPTNTTLDSLPPIPPRRKIRDPEQNLQALVHQSDGRHSKRPRYTTPQAQIRKAQAKSFKCFKCSNYSPTKY